MTDVVEMDDTLYKEVFNSGNPPKKPWFVAFIRKRRTEPDSHESAYIVN